MIQSLGPTSRTKIPPGLAIARDHFPRILLLRQTVVGLGSPADVFTPDRLRVAYGESIQIVATPGGPSL